MVELKKVFRNGVVVKSEYMTKDRLYYVRPSYRTSDGWLLYKLDSNNDKYVCEGWFRTLADIRNYII